MTIFTCAINGLTIYLPFLNRRYTATHQSDTPKNAAAESADVIHMPQGPWLTYP
jgi:hypothetical protein